MSQHNFLRSAGLLNEAIDIDDLIDGEHKKSIGFCTSRSCHGSKLTGATPKWEAKSTKCPDCGHVLFYKSLTSKQIDNVKAGHRRAWKR